MNQYLTFFYISFVGGHLVVRATHNIAKGSEISHCYGESRNIVLLKFPTALFF